MQHHCSTTLGLFWIIKQHYCLSFSDKKLLKVENSKVFKYSPFKQLTDKQYDLEVKLLGDIAETLKSGQNRNIIVEGWAETGKSILAVSLIKYIADICTQKINYTDTEIYEDVESYMCKCHAENVGL